MDKYVFSVETTRHGLDLCSQSDKREYY